MPIALVYPKVQGLGRRPRGIERMLPYIFCKKFNLLDRQWRMPSTMHMRYTHPSGFPHTGRKLIRIQLRDVSDADYIYIHVGNVPEEVEGCFLIGMTAGKDPKDVADRVDWSADAIRKIGSILQADGTDNLTVIVIGAPGSL